jgi:hypothetical protein
VTAAGQTQHDLYIETVQVLTRAARRRDYHGEPCDFAGFLAQVLAATAANVGGPDKLLAGRPGSWEAGYLESLLQGTMGDEQDGWLSFRTEPLVVPLNVAELNEKGDRHLGLRGLNEAIVAVDRKYESVESDEAPNVWSDEVVQVTTRYRDGYRRYAERFASAVRDAAAQIPGTHVEVVITVDADPLSAWWSDLAINNPNRDGGDELVFELWSAAHDAVALPNVDIRLGQPSATLPVGDKP